MDPEHPEVMDPRPEVLRQQIDETRSSLTEKLETLESEVMGTVHSVTESVEQTIENVKDTVEDTVDSVKKTFDLDYQVQRHPWAMVGGSVAAGCVAATLLGAVSRSGRGGWAPAAEAASTLASAPSHSGPSASYQPTASAPPRAHWLTSFLHHFDREIEEVKELAIGTAMGLLRDYLKQALPPALEPRVSEVLDSATSKLGGRPVNGPIVEPAASGAAHANPGQPAW